MASETRHAILFGGIPDRRHLNGLEFCYRTLVDRCGFDPENIHVLCQDGSLRAEDDSPGTAHTGLLWPGDGTPYRMKVTGEGNGEAFRAVLDGLRATLRGGDLLFINTTGHGGDNGDGRGPYIVGYPYRNLYKMSQLREDLASLPPYGTLLVLMAQCFSGGFNTAVLEGSRAKHTFFAAAADQDHRSFAVGAWDSFQRNCIGAMARHDVNGAPLPSGSPMSDGRIDMRAVFDYANDPRVKDPRDTPQWAESCNHAQPLSSQETGVPLR